MKVLIAVTHLLGIGHLSWHYRPPKGESPAEVWHRLAPWIAGLSTDTVAVCHIGVMRVILARAHQWDFRGSCPFAIKRNRLFVVALAKGRIIPLNPPIRLEKRTP